MGPFFGPKQINNRKGTNMENIQLLVVHNFLIELFDKMSKERPITYEISLLPDGDFLIRTIEKREILEKDEIKIVNGQVDYIWKEGYGFFIKLYWAAQEYRCSKMKG